MKYRRKSILMFLGSDFFGITESTFVKRTTLCKQYFHKAFVIKAMSAKTLRLFTLIAGLIPFTLLTAQTGGNAIYKFMDIPVTARQSAFGGKMVPVKDNDFNSILSNPSLLNSSMSKSLGFSYVNYIADVNYFYAAYSQHYEKIGSFAASIQALNYGKFKTADATGFTAADYCFNIQYARPLKDSTFSVGGTLKTIYSHLDQYTSFGNAIDAGITYLSKNKLLTSSLLVKNVGRQWKEYTQGVKEPLSMDVQLGVSFKLSKAPLRFFMVLHDLHKWDLTYEDPNNPTATTDPLTGDPIKVKRTNEFLDKAARHAIFGLEIVPSKNVNIQFGYNYQRRKELKFDGRAGVSGFCLGFGIKISKFNISYSHAQFNTAAGADHITIATNLSSFYSKK